MNEKDSSRNSISSEETLNERERLIQKLYFIRGNIKLDLDILLEVNSPDMENILPALEDFIEETNRF
jgi:hypothetical protein